MAADGLARKERLALCALFTRLGPDAPTLCEGWLTRDLAAHLVARELYPLSIPGMTMPLFHPITERYERRARERFAYAELVEQLRAGPPATSPVGLPGLSNVLNIHEFYVHHEDVRRANGGRPRRLSPALDTALWLRLRVTGPFLFRSMLGCAVHLETTDGRAMTVLPGTSGRLTLQGPTGDLFMFAYNRRDGAKVDIGGDDRAQQRLQRVRLGV
jgi:uncharacterized protein (TIGR03085 family)